MKITSEKRNSIVDLGRTQNSFCLAIKKFGIIFDVL